MNYVISVVVVVRVIASRPTSTASNEPVIPSRRASGKGVITQESFKVTFDIIKCFLCAVCLCSYVLNAMHEILLSFIVYTILPVEVTIVKCIPLHIHVSCLTKE